MLYTKGSWQQDELAAELGFSSSAISKVSKMTQGIRFRPLSSRSLELQSTGMAVLVCILMRECVLAALPILILHLT